jgi:pimeloyl-CoA synthetase
VVRAVLDMKLSFKKSVASAGGRIFFVSEMFALKEILHFDPC